ncbi:MAG: cation transporter [Sulfurovum sp.]|nr:cation transporter [Sulfurovum sp.]
MKEILKQTFEVKNVKCGGCANTLKKALLQDFGEITVNLDVEPRQITLGIEEADIASLQSSLRTLGYPLTSDTLSTFETIGTTAKSFISCAKGKLDK